LLALGPPPVAALAFRDDRELANVKLAAAVADRRKNVRRFIEPDVLAMFVLLACLLMRSSVELLFREELR
jgi:hypothetical protein